MVDTLPLQVGRWLQGEWAAKGWEAVDLLPVEERQSNVFRVRLPDQRLTVAARAPVR